MKLTAILIVSLIGLEHIGIMIVEMFFWDHPIGRSAFDMTAQQSADTAILAKNQGLYNGFLAAGILWSLICKKRDVVSFFLICVIIAGVFGAATAKPSILFAQALPAAIALCLWIISGRETVLPDT